DHRGEAARHRAEEAMAAIDDLARREGLGRIGQRPGRPEHQGGRRDPGGEQRPSPQDRAPIGFAGPRRLRPLLDVRHEELPSPDVANPWNSRPRLWRETGARRLSAKRGLTACYGFYHAPRGRPALRAPDARGERRVADG